MLAYIHNAFIKAFVSGRGCSDGTTCVIADVPNPALLGVILMLGEGFYLPMMVRIFDAFSESFVNSRRTFDESAARIGDVPDPADLRDVLADHNHPDVQCMAVMLRNAVMLMVMMVMIVVLMRVMYWRSMVCRSRMMLEPLLRMWIAMGIVAGR